ncbi:MAG: HIT family protein [Candidatus Tectomicrobia bacterium]|uniref:HIT family protein n=1 Tax=Tectimicrobiota bacterium TaxID=2528274 RepID=A0A938B466_UNCTE|nr:HIT family protein [Candidatus Tectomicrobia bacterium]
MSPAGCALCTLVEKLKDMEVYPSPMFQGRDVWKIYELPTAIAILRPDQYYPGNTLVVAKTHATELYHLPLSESTQYYQDILRMARALALAFTPRKMNYALLGNTEAHLHWHLVPRYDWDPNPQRPIAEYPHAPTVLTPQEYAETIAAIRRALT